MTLGAISAHERRSLFGRTTTVLTLAMCIAVSGYALYRGAVKRHALVAAQDSFLQSYEAKHKKWRERLAAVQRGDTKGNKDRWAGLAMDFAPPAALPPGALADFSTGVSDLQPMVTTVSQWRTIDRLFDNYQFESPAALAAGPFDLAFVVIFLLPLAMITLSYDTLSGDREQGRLGFLLSNAISLRGLVVARLRVRFGAIIALFLLMAGMGLVLGAASTDFDFRLGRFAIWSAIGVLYLGWWAAMLAWVVSLNKRGDTTVLLMVGLWAVTSLVVPAGATAVAESLYPSPSRLDFLSQVRSKSSLAFKARSKLVKGMVLDHPELVADDYSLPEYIRTAFVVSRSVDREVQPVIDAFDVIYDARYRFLHQVQYVSPAIVALQGFNESAGTALHRQRTFERSARSYKRTLADRLEAKVLAGRRLTLEDVDGMPEFQFQEPAWRTVASRLAMPAVYFVVLGLLFAWRTGRNLQRLQTRIRER